MINIDNKFDFGDRVYLNLPKVSEEVIHHCGIVTAVSIRLKDSITYEVTWNDKLVTWHFDFELNKEPVLV